MQQPTAAAPVLDITLAGARTAMSAADKLQARTKTVQHAQAVTSAGGPGPKPGDVDDALDQNWLAVHVERFEAALAAEEIDFSREAIQPEDADGFLHDLVAEINRSRGRDITDLRRSTDYLNGDIWTEHNCYTYSGPVGGSILTLYWTPKQVVEILLDELPTDHGVLVTTDPALARAVAKEPAASPAEKSAAFWERTIAEIGDDPWALATKMVTVALLGERLWPGADALPHPPTSGDDPWDGGLAERWGRAVAACMDRDLQFVIPLAWVMTSIASEGAFYLDLPEREPVEVPLVLQFVGVARSGSGKSTTLNSFRPLINQALDAGVARRVQWVAEQTAKYAGIDKSAEAGKASGELVRRLLSAAVCPSTVTDTGTPEGIRDNLASGGCHRAVVTDEDDMLVERSGYKSGGADTGSLNPIIKGWDRHPFTADRAARSAGNGRLRTPDPITLESVTLPIAMVVQQDAFVSGTSSGAFETKGVLSRWLLGIGSERIIPSTYSLPPVAATPDGDPERARIEECRSLARVAWSALSVRGSAYRAAKAAKRAILAARINGENVGELAEIDAGRGVQLKIDGAKSLEVYRHVQQMRLDVLRALKEAGLDSSVAEPFAQRLTQHVYRIAMTRALFDDPEATEIPARYVQDTATRYLPWLVGQWARLTLARTRQVGHDAVGEMLRSNPGMEDRSVRGVVLRVLLSRTAHRPRDMFGDSRGGYRPEPGRSMTAASVASKVRDMGGGPASRQARYSAAKAELPRLVDEGLVAKLNGKANAAGQVSERYQITEAGIAQVTADRKIRPW